MVILFHKTTNVKGVPNFSRVVAGWKRGDTNHRSEPEVPAARFLSKMGKRLLCTFCTNVPFCSAPLKSFIFISTYCDNSGLPDIAVPVGDAGENDNLAFLGCFTQNGTHETQPFRVGIT